MFNSTKLLLSVVIVIVFSTVVLAAWILTPQHSGVAMSIGIILLPFAGVFIAWVNDTPRAY